MRRIVCKGMALSVEAMQQPAEMDHHAGTAERGEQRNGGWGIKLN
jgi:hypothetical protein